MLFHVQTKKQLLHAAIFCCFLILPIIWSFQTSTRLDSIRNDGVLVFGTINSPTTYFTDKLGPAGFEYELAQHFAEFLGLELNVVQFPNQKTLLNALANKDILIAGANIEVTEDVANTFSTSPPYLQTQPYLVYRIQQGKKPPQSLDQTYDRQLVLPNDSSAVKSLHQLKEQWPDLAWVVDATRGDLGMMEAVQQSDVDLTIIGDLSYKLNRTYVPGINKSIPVGDAMPISWIYEAHPDHSFSQKVKDFFALESTKDLLHELKPRYFERENSLGFLDIVTFNKHREQRLPSLLPYFKDASDETGIDWRFLAALAYQESHWNPKAVSPTGVKGVMMLTLAAAAEVNVDDRVDAEQSIRGGARYFVKTLAKIPERVSEEDKVWFALAAYNVGFGHLEDARVLTQRAGKNPNKWDDVKAHLPLLTKPAYYNTVKHGYARGYEPVTYVKNIRKYLDLMDWDHAVQQMRSASQQNTETPETDTKRSTRAFPRIPIAL
ncbi:MAG: membrane-bound lytic murein transglycosylase MltF [Pontibacterium sp.]